MSNQELAGESVMVFTDSLENDGMGRHFQGWGSRPAPSARAIVLAAQQLQGAHRKMASLGKHAYNPPALRLVSGVRRSSKEGDDIWNIAISTRRNGQPPSIPRSNVADCQSGENIAPPCVLTPRWQNRFCVSPANAPWATPRFLPLHSWSDCTPV